MFKNLAIILVMFTGACQGPSDAEIQTYKVIAPEYRKYVDNDPTLAPDAKDRRRYLLIAWGMRLGL